MALPDNIIYIDNILPEIIIDGTRQIDYWNAWRVAEDFKESTKFLDDYVVEEGITWHDIAEVVYNERDLWWVVPLFNEIENPFLMFSESNVGLKNKKLKILKPSHLTTFLNQIRRLRLQADRDL